MFASLGRWCFRNRRVVLIGWVVALISAGLLANVIVGTAYDGAFETPDSESADGFITLQEYFPTMGGTQLTGSIVFQSDAGVDDPAVKETIESLLADLATTAEVDGVYVFDAAQVASPPAVSVISPYADGNASQISPDGTVAYATLNLDPTLDQTGTGLIGGLIREHLPEVDGLTIEVGGAMLAEFEPPETELIGVAFAVFVLILAFGSVLAMGLPISVALFGVFTGASVVGLLTHLFPIPDFAPLIGVMIGLGVGIDYALFIVTRYREELRKGASFEDATVTAMDTAGRAVAFAGVTVVVSLLGMLIIGLAFVSGMGIAASATVFVTLIASLTLLPALLGFAQGRIEVTRWRGLVAASFAALALFGLGLGHSALGAFGAIMTILTMVAGFVVPFLKREVPARVEKPIRDTIAYKWSRLVQAHPILFLFVGGGALVVLTLPLFGIRMGFSDEGNYSEETTTRRAYDLLADGFGPGTNGPFILAIELDDPSGASALEALQAAVAADPGVAFASPPIPNNMEDPAASEAFLMQVVPTSAPQAAETSDTVHRLRDIVIPGAIGGAPVTANLTGAVPTSVDFSTYMAGRSFWFFGVVLALSFLLLMAVFRSLLVPLKAVVMNMLSISGAYGIVVAIFQWGWFGSITGVEPAPIEPFIPMMMFAIVFGLSMDYEVFLLSRVKEEFDRTGNARESVADGLAATARVITAAAAIMVVVFGAFLLEDDRVIKLMGTGLATAVLLDASLVRMLLVPATMELLGDKNWWIPSWLDKILPSINVEGPSHHA